MTDLRNANNFSVVLQDKHSKQSKIDDALASFNASLAQDLARPVLKGTLCAALFADDGNWYRAKVLGNKDQHTVEVKFIDFGNIRVVKTDGELK